MLDPWGRGGGDDDSEASFPGCLGSTTLSEGQGQGLAEQSSHTCLVKLIGYT